MIIVLWECCCWFSALAVSNELGVEFAYAYRSAECNIFQVTHLATLSKDLIRNVVTMTTEM